MNAMERDKEQGEGGRGGIYVENLVDRYRWTDFYACKNGLHCSKMNMLNALDFSNIFFMYFLQQA
jgi:hypothetical protein